MKTLSQILSYPIRKIDFIIRKKQFAQVGKCFMFQKPLRINGAKNIFIGDNVKIHDQVWLAAMSLTRMGGQSWKLEMVAYLEITIIFLQPIVSYSSVMC